MTIANQLPNDLTLDSLDIRISEFCKKRGWGEKHTPRNLLLALIGEAGELSEIFQWRGECLPGLPDFTESDRIHVGEEMSDVLIYLIEMARNCSVDLPSAVLKKMVVNAIKYPSKDGSSDDFSVNPRELTFDMLAEMTLSFSVARGWNDADLSPRNLLFALIAEVGELSEIFQWRGECQPGLSEFTPEDKIHVGEEMSDVLLYLVQLARVCGISLSDAVLDKIVKNGIKYPPRV
ncbi:UNVERIFIED_CONTAM: dCTP pyrophosphatase 1 [Siphonaria sp. JEL0065]|nr:dCTP pyrophosphatase 1 [Siphonaria sp. JEL0065]